MKTKVLILCTGNSCRSQMAEGILRRYGAGKFEVFSAGTRPSNINVTVIKVMQEIGVDISKQRSKHVDQFLNKKIDYVISVCDNAEKVCPIFPGEATRLHWPFPDPPHDSEINETVLNEFRKVRDLILDRFRKLGETGVF